ncbi:MAG: HPr family phosphocarrier protein [Solobacterium sp.]|jgi:phosphocarrier protein|nr:HPr family phosphocarrier protein [Solobacterium sp.]MBR2843988.1 HPr family phosphocarrier protein [Solobacterium sp.]MBR3343428.1 HPr family phosphocarrier protein [Solobacterium sp.]HAE15146.1 HPr family phosphocarrier protein [Erysipelotrichaceae bacterium]
MIEIQLAVKDPKGIHARPAGKIVAALQNYESFVTVWKGEQGYDVKKLLSFMGSELKFGDTIVVRVEGKDEAECAETVKKVFEENL